jgi:hypothetical protein
MRNARHRDQIGRTAGITPSHGKVTLATVGLLTSRVVAACSPSQAFLQRPSGFVEQAARRLQLRGQFRPYTGIPFSPRRMNATAPSLPEVVNLGQEPVNSLGHLGSGARPPMGFGLMLDGAGFGGGFSGGLITGVRDALAGGGSTISASPVGGGLNTLGSSVGVAGGVLPGGVSGTALAEGGGAQDDGDVAGSQAGGVDAAQAALATAMAITAAPVAIFSVVFMAHLTSVAPPPPFLYAMKMAKPCV